jgi:hypothetical protein
MAAFLYRTSAVPVLFLEQSRRSSSRISDLAQTGEKSRADIKNTEVLFEQEAAMYRSIKPAKEQVREWLREGIAQHRPPPDLHEIRRQLGWDLKEEEYQAHRLRTL